jgi:hypothetical protein
VLALLDLQPPPTEPRALVISIAVRRKTFGEKDIVHTLLFQLADTAANVGLNFARMLDTRLATYYFWPVRTI